MEEGKCSRGSMLRHLSNSMRAELSTMYYLKGPVESYKINKVNGPNTTDKSE